MQQAEVKIIRSEVPKRLVKGGERLAGTNMAVPDLACNKHIVSGKAAFFQCAADSAFISVYGGGVEMTVSRLQRPQDRALGLGAVLRAVDAKAQLRHFDAVGQRQISLPVHSRIAIPS